MLFMKGTPDAPRCGFSNQIVQLLDMAHIKYDTFDILSDEEVTPYHMHAHTHTHFVQPRFSPSVCLCVCVCRCARG